MPRLVICSSSSPGEGGGGGRGTAVLTLPHYAAKGVSSTPPHLCGRHRVVATARSTLVSRLAELTQPRIFRMRNNPEEAKAGVRAAGAVLNRLIVRYKNGEGVTRHEVDVARDRLRHANKRLIDAMTSDARLRARLN